MKIYVVTAGELSDAMIVGLCGTREAAEAMAAAFLATRGSLWNPISVAEYEADATADDRTVWVAKCQEHSAVESWSNGADFVPAGWCCVSLPQKTAWHVEFEAASAVSQAHAEDLVTEARQKWLREQVTPAPSVSPPEDGPASGPHGNRS